MLLIERGGLMTLTSLKRTGPQSNWLVPFHSLLNWPVCFTNVVCTSILIIMITTITLFSFASLLCVRLFLFAIEALCMCMLWCLSRHLLTSGREAPGRALVPLLRQGQSQTQVWQGSGPCGLGSRSHRQCFQFRRQQQLHRIQLQSIQFPDWLFKLWWIELIASCKWLALTVYVDSIQRPLFFPD